MYKQQPLLFVYFTITKYKTCSQALQATQVAVSKYYATQRHTPVKAKERKGKEMSHAYL
jgi:hypothetical protein